MTVSQVPDHFDVLAKAIRDLSVSFQKSVPDLIQKVRFADEGDSGDIRVGLDWSDQDGKVNGVLLSIVFGVWNAELGKYQTRFENRMGNIPAGWNKKDLFRALFRFATALGEWEPVTNILFCPTVSRYQLYTTDDLKSAKWTEDGWDLDIRGMFNGGDEYDTGLRIISEDELLVA